MTQLDMKERYNKITKKLKRRSIRNDMYTQ